jgi:hypothetical protein
MMAGQAEALVLENWRQAVVSASAKTDRDIIPQKAKPMREHSVP